MDPLVFTALRAHWNWSRQADYWSPCKTNRTEKTPNGSTPLTAKGKYFRTALAASCAMCITFSLKVVLLIKMLIALVVCCRPASFDMSSMQIRLPAGLVCCAFDAACCANRPRLLRLRCRAACQGRSPSHDCLWVLFRGRARAKIAQWSAWFCIAQTMCFNSAQTQRTYNF